MRTIKTVLKVLQWIQCHGLALSAAATAIATVVIACLTYYYVSYSKAQWQTMEKQLAAFRTAESANLGIESSAEGDKVVVRITNYGKLPSPKATIWVTIDRIDTENKVGEQTPLSFTSDMPPGITRTVNIPLSLSLADIERIKEDRLRVLVATSAEYNDGFGEQRRVFNCVNLTRHRWSLCAEPSKIA